MRALEYMARRTPCAATAAAPAVAMKALGTLERAGSVARACVVNTTRPLHADRLHAAVSALSNQFGVVPPPCAASHRSRNARLELRVTQIRIPRCWRLTLRGCRMIRFNHGMVAPSGSPVSNRRQRVLRVASARVRRCVCGSRRRCTRQMLRPRLWQGRPPPSTAPTPREQHRFRYC